MVLIALQAQKASSSNLLIPVPNISVSNDSHPANISLETTFTDDGIVISGKPDEQDWYYSLRMSLLLS